MMNIIHTVWSESSTWVWTYQHWKFWFNEVCHKHESALKHSPNDTCRLIRCSCFHIMLYKLIIGMRLTNWLIGVCTTFLFWMQFLEIIVSHLHSTVSGLFWWQLHCCIVSEQFMWKSILSPWRTDSTRTSLSGIAHNSWKVLTWSLLGRISR